MSKFWVNKEPLVATGSHRFDRPTDEWCQNLRNQILVAEKNLVRTVSEKFPKNLEGGGSYTPYPYEGLRDFWFNFGDSGWGPFKKYVRSNMSTFYPSPFSYRKTFQV